MTIFRQKINVIQTSKGKGPKNRFVKVFRKTENDSKANDHANDSYNSGGRQRHSLPTKNNAKKKFC